ncbi:copper-binding protein (NosD) [Enhydrobacter aerosaccus]|uniref:Copper-binding protein (NosD) n=1 Tax=Enhydrobacter aerosaccus TaxID=225324 RepID=A0A1T4K0D3_9HYPH|nr:glycosyl hydrolase family 28-related protein [Enhydrobacter aerosaccus]SJZ35972.1 copper-binding protein (NosD) [Enhydrobacter aerosaccus]
MEDFEFVSTLNAAQRRTFPDQLLCIETKGFGSPGDGGGATYRRCKDEPNHGGSFRSHDGSWWEIASRSVNVKQFGAVGDGLTDDSAAIQAAFDAPFADEVIFPPGSYSAIGLRLRRSCLLRGHHAEIVYDREHILQDLLFASAPRIEIRDITFRGRIYQDFHTSVGPECLLRAGGSADELVDRLTITDVDFVGGQHGCVIGMVTDVFIDRVRFHKCRFHALAVYKEVQRVVVRGLIAKGIGLYGGVKTALYSEATRPTEKFIITEFLIEDCASLHPDPFNWQEGIDLICGWAREFIVSNGVISRCGNGGIELKTGGIQQDLDETYEDMIISNVVINTDGNHSGIVFNWTGGKTNSDKRGRRTVVTGNIIRHTNGKGLAAGILVNAWSDVILSNNFIEGSHTGIALNGYGASDDTLKSVMISGNHMRSVHQGLYGMSGNLEDIAVINNDIQAEALGIALSDAHVRGCDISQNRIRQYGRDTSTTLAALYVKNAQGVRIFGNRLDAAGGHAVFVHDCGFPLVGGAILSNFMASKLEPVRIQTGKWTVLDNHIQMEVGLGAVVEEGAASTVEAFWNIRGTADRKPAAAGSVGDVFFFPRMGRADPMGWVCVVAGGRGVAEWRELGNVELGAEHTSRSSRAASHQRPARSLGVPTNRQAAGAVPIGATPKTNDVPRPWRKALWRRIVDLPVAAGSAVRSRLWNSKSGGS